MTAVDNRLAPAYLAGAYPVSFTFLWETEADSCQKATLAKSWSEIRIEAHFR
jgi:hypothetical protein